MMIFTAYYFVRKCTFLNYSFVCLAIYGSNENINILCINVDV